MKNAIKKPIQNIEEDVLFLTGNEASGRLSGTQGAKKAAENLAGQLKKMGYEPYGSSYFESIQVKAARLEGPVRLKIGNRSFQHRKDFSELTRYTGTGSANGQLYIIRDGDKVNTQDLIDKVVLIAERPEGFDLKGTIQSAIKHGVRALLIEGGNPAYFPKTLFGNKDGIIPILRVKKALIPELERMSGELAEIKLPLQVSVKECQNVIGVLPGLSSERIVVLSAHYDHLGDDPGGFRFPGAIDNASGVVTILEVARRVSSQARPLSYTLIVAFFSGEESGMIGAKHFLNHIKRPVSAAINIDCLGQEEHLSLMRIGYDSPDHWFPILAADILKKHDVDIVWKAFNGDDSVAFRKKNIPVLGLGQKSVEGGLKIHTPEDCMERLYLSPVVKMSEIIKEILLSLYQGGEKNELH